MDKREAQQLLREELSRWRQRSYAELSARIGQSHRSEVTGASGAWYQLEIRVFWDNRPHEDIRVAGSIDDGRLRAFVPLSDDFILSPTGSFVDEDTG